MERIVEAMRLPKQPLQCPTMATAGNVLTLAALLLLVIVGLGIRSVVLSESKSTKLGFENIGELATQTAYCTSVNVTEGSRELFGVTIPFTQSKYIYSYDIVIKAGFDFTESEITGGKNTEQ